VGPFNKHDDKILAILTPFFLEFLKKKFAISLALTMTIFKYFFVFLQTFLKNGHFEGKAYGESKKLEIPKKIKVGP
jgi:hypothetical protein